PVPKQTAVLTEQVVPSQDNDHASPPTVGPTPGEKVGLRCPHCDHSWNGPVPPPGRPCRCPKCHKPVPVPKSAATRTPGPAVVPPGYELMGELGRGAFGMVYKVRDVALNRIVALKVMRPDVDPELLPRFRIEAQAVARMQHPNIVPIFTVSEHQGRLFC